MAVCSEHGLCGADGPGLAQILVGKPCGLQTLQTDYNTSGWRERANEGSERERMKTEE